MQLFLFVHNLKSEFFRAIWSSNFFWNFHFFRKFSKFLKFEIFQQKIKFFMKKHTFQSQLQQSIQKIWEHPKYVEDRKFYELFDCQKIFGARASVEYSISVGITTDTPPCFEISWKTRGGICGESHTFLRAPTPDILLIYVKIFAPAAGNKTSLTIIN